MIICFIVGTLVGYFIAAIMAVSGHSDSFDEGYAAGITDSNSQGKVIARNEPMNEIMVEYGNDTDRYVKVKV